MCAPQVCRGEPAIAVGRGIDLDHLSLARQYTIEVRQVSLAIDNAHGQVLSIGHTYHNAAARGTLYLTDKRDAAWLVHPWRPIVIRSFSLDALGHAGRTVIIDGIAAIGDVVRAIAVLR